MSDKVTVKQTINKATSIYKIEHITVGKPGSEQYRHAFELADQLGLKHPDCIEHVFPTYAYEGDELKCYEHGLLIESVE
ncbi:hypothetical protein [Escherichia coli]|uniref:hypothetical protein n=1 Tax=Escherichia coli TaxID=562 RepID=UPI0028833700|nr:hypothetical protein [Escherichia coli]